MTSHRLHLSSPSELALRLPRKTVNTNTAANQDEQTAIRQFAAKSGQFAAKSEQTKIRIGGLVCSSWFARSFAIARVLSLSHSRFMDIPE